MSAVSKTMEVNKDIELEKKYYEENMPTKFDMYNFEPIPYEDFEVNPYEEMPEEYNTDVNCNCYAYCVCDMSDSEFEIEYEGPLKYKDAF